MPNDIHTAAIYIRVSTRMQTEKFSLGAQKRILTELCDKNGWNYILYEDAGISGKNIADRPAMTRLLDDADNNKFQAVCVIEWERLSRDIDLLDSHYIKKVLRDNSIKVVTPHQSFDLTDDEDDFISDLFAILSKREKKKIINRMMRGKVEAVRKGVYPGGNVPYGYIHNTTTSKLEIVEEQAEIVRLIFHLCNVENMSAEKIAAVLNARDVPTHREITNRSYPHKNPHVTGWYDGTIRGILKNPVYMGKFAYMKKKGNRERRKQEEWVYGSNPAIVSEQEFNLASKRLKDRKMKSVKNKKYSYLLSSKIKCDYCNGSLHGITYKYKSRKNGKPNGISKYSYYKCYGRLTHVGGYCKLPYVKVKALDDLVWEIISSAIKHPDIIKTALTAKIEKVDTHIDISALEKQVQQNKAKEESMFAAYTAGAISINQLKTQNHKLLEKREALELEIAQAHEQQQQNINIESTFERLEELITTVQDHIDNLDFDRKKIIIDLIVENITVKIDGTIDVHCCIPFFEPLILQEFMAKSEFPIQSGARSF